MRSLPWPFHLSGLLLFFMHFRDPAETSSALPGEHLTHFTSSFPPRVRCEISLFTMNIHQVYIERFAVNTQHLFFLMSSGEKENLIFTFVSLWETASL